MICWLSSSHHRPARSGSITQTSTHTHTHIPKDYSSLSAADKLSYIQRDSPELLALLSEFQEQLKQLHTHTQSYTHAHAKTSTENGVSFYELKFHLMLQYCINISFYLLLKAEGKQVHMHPVVSIYIHKQMCVSLCLCMRVCVCMRVCCICVCMYVDMEQ